MTLNTLRFLLLFAFMQAPLAYSRNLYISKVKKDSVHTFYNRLATPDAQIVITSKPVPGAAEAHLLEEKNEEHLFILEPAHLKPSAYPGEKLRLAGFVIAALPKASENKHIHLEGDPLTYIEKIAAVEITVAPSIKAAALRRSAVRRNFDIDPNYLKEKMSEFSGAKPVVIGGVSTTISERGTAAGRNNARKFLKQEYQALGFSVWQHSYGSGTNFIAEREGTDPSKFLIISAHLDSVTNAGADDDGAGTIGALAVAKALSGVPLKHTLRIVGFDEEEKGLVGSEKYAVSLNDTGEMAKMISLINLEMLGYDKDNDGAFHIIDCNENTSAEISNLLMQKVTSASINVKKVAACTNRSDHAVFWRYNRPAVVISQNFFGGDDNPCYHKACDKTDILNFPYMANLTKAVALTVADLIGAD
jgi:hypothetical protein